MKVVLKSVFLILLSILVGYLLLAFSWFLFPGEACRSHLDETVALLKKEGPFPEDAYSQKLLDNYTDSTMISEAIDSSEANPFLHAVSAPYAVAENKDPFESFLAVYSGAEQPVSASSYARYWHGYLLFLKPALKLFSYRQIRHLNAVVQLVLLAAVVLLLQKRAKSRFLISFVLMILFMGPTAIANSLQFSSVYYVMMGFVLLLLCRPQLASDRYRSYFLFLFSGIVTAYLDFLTAPTVTLTVPLTVLCIILTEKREKEIGKHLLLCAVFWFAGYAGMWSGKWVIAFAVQRGAFVNTLLDTLRFRSSTQLVNTSISRSAAVLRCLKMMLSNYYLDVFTALYAIFVFLDGLACWHKTRAAGGLRRTLSGLIPFTVPILVSFLWIVLLANHSYIHASFLTFRMLCPLVFCGLVMLDEAMA